MKRKPIDPHKVLADYAKVIRARTALMLVDDQSEHAMWIASGLEQAAAAADELAKLKWPGLPPGN